MRAGHSSVAFTLDRYGHLYERSDDSISDRLDEVLGDATAPSDGAILPLARGSKGST